MAKNKVNLFTVYELGTWSQHLSANFTLEDCLFGAVKLNKYTDSDKYSFSGYGIWFDSCSLFSFPNFNWCTNFVIFGVDKSSSVQIHNKKYIS